MSHHTSDPVCPLCEEKLSEVHPYLRDWFRKKKTRYLDMHVSWGFRDKACQEACFQEGATKLHFPASAHNRTDDSGAPLAWAVDVFQIQEDGIATFNPMFYQRLGQEIADDGDELLWGGQWRHLGDRDHFQYQPKVILSAA